jgi:LysR family transcriptional regulator, hydrogen peroxide-inducible genes activator
MIVRRHCEALSATSQFFTARGVRPEFSYRGDNDDRVLALVRAGLGITVMPDSYADPGVRRPKLKGFDQQREIGLLFPEAALEDEASRAIMGAIRLAAIPAV